MCCTGNIGKEFWTSGNKLGSEDSWIWMSSGEQLNATFSEYWLQQKHQGGSGSVSFRQSTFTFTINRAHYWVEQYKKGSNATMYSPHILFQGLLESTVWPCRLPPTRGPSFHQKTVDGRWLSFANNFVAFTTITLWLHSRILMLKLKLQPWEQT